MRTVLDGRPTTFAELKPGTFFSYWRDKPVFGLSLQPYDGRPASATFSSQTSAGATPSFVVHDKGLVIAYDAAALKPELASVSENVTNIPVGSIVQTTTFVALKVALERGDTGLFDLTRGEERIVKPGQPIVFYARWEAGFERQTGFETFFSFPFQQNVVKSRPL